MALTNWHPVFLDSYDPLKAGSIDATDTEPHDHGVVRAMEAKYRPNRKVVGDPKKTLFIARLNSKTDEHAIEKRFSRYGEIKKLRLVRDIVTGFSKCYAFLEYAELSVAEFVSQKCHKLEIDGQEVLVDFECERTLKGWIPRRLGGGLGGKKESGQLRFGGRDRPFRKPITMKNKQGSVDFDENWQEDSDKYYRYSRRDYETDKSSRVKDRNRYKDDRHDSISRDKDRRGYRRSGRSRERKRERSRERRRNHSRDRSCDHSKDRSRDRSQGRIRDHSRERRRDRYRDRHRNRSRSIEKNNGPKIVLPDNIDDLIKESMHSIWDNVEERQVVSVKKEPEENSV